MADKSVPTGGYTAAVSHPEVATVISDQLPVYKGIRLYPIRFGVFRTEHTQDELSEMKIVQDTSGKYIPVNEKIKTYIGRQAGTYYPMLDAKGLYEYYPMPLRMGWIYVVSKYAKGVYEYSHQNFTFKLIKFYTADKTSTFPTNTTQQYFIHIPENDRIYIMYSEVRLEECLIRARFFQNNELRILYFFDAKRWVDPNDNDYKTSGESRRIEPLKLEMAFGWDERIGDTYPLYKNVIEEAIINNPPEKKKKDIFFIIDDVIGVGNQLAEDVKTKHVEFEAFIRSVRTGQPMDEMLQKLLQATQNNTDSVKDVSSIISDEKLCPGIDITQPLYMNSLAVVLKSFFFGENTPESMKSYKEEGQKKLDEKMLDNVLATGLRKDFKNLIDRYRAALHYYLTSEFFQDYSRFFLDREEYPCKNEGELAFYLNRVEYDYNTDGFAYNNMLWTIFYWLVDLYQALMLDPDKRDLYMSGEPVKKSEVQKMISQTEDAMIHPDINKPKMAAAIFMKKKEIIPLQYFPQYKAPIEAKDKTADVKTGESADRSSLLDEIFLPVTSIVSTFTSILLSPKNVTCVFEILESKGYVATADFSKMNVQVTNYEEVEKKMQVLIRDRGVAYAIQESDNLKVYELKIEMGKGGKGIKIDTVNRKIHVHGVRGVPRAQWNGVKNTNIPKYMGLSTAEFVEKLHATKGFMAIAGIFAYFAIKDCLENKDRHLLDRINSVVGTTFTIAALSGGLLEKTFQLSMERMVEVPQAVRVVNRAIPATVSVGVLFKGFAVIANTADGFDGLFRAIDQGIKGDTFGGISYGVTGALLIISVAAIPIWGWTVYLIITLVLALIKIILNYVIDTDMQIFLKYTIFSIDRKYEFESLSYSRFSDRLQYFYDDIQKLSSTVNAGIKRPDSKKFMADFRAQFEEFMYCYGFIPSFHNCAVSLPKQAYIYQKGDPNRYKFDYPTDFSLYITGDFSHFPECLTDIDFEVYMSYKNDPKYTQMSLLDKYFSPSARSQLIQNRKYEPPADGDMDFVLVDSYDGWNTGRFKYKQGILHYRFSISEENPYNREVSQFKTWPFIERPTYYIFIYIRFRLGGKDWSPATRKGDNQYLIYRYKLERPDRDTKHNPRNFFEYEIKVDKIYVGVKPQPKLK